MSIYIMPAFYNSVLHNKKAVMFSYGKDDKTVGYDTQTCMFHGLMTFSNLDAGRAFVIPMIPNESFTRFIFLNQPLDLYETFIGKDAYSLIYSSRCFMHFEIDDAEGLKKVDEDEINGKPCIQLIRYVESSLQDDTYAAIPVANYIGLSLTYIRMQRYMESI